MHQEPHSYGMTHEQHAASGAPVAIAATDAAPAIMQHQPTKNSKRPWPPPLPLQQWFLEWFGGPCQSHLPPPPACPVAEDAPEVSDPCREDVFQYKILRDSNINRNVPLGEYGGLGWGGG